MNMMQTSRLERVGWSELRTEAESLIREDRVPRDTLISLIRDFGPPEADPQIYECAMCGADLTRSGAVEETYRVTASLRGRIDTSGAFEPDGDGAEVAWDSAGDSRYECRHCDSQVQL